MNKDSFLQEALIQAINTGTQLRLEASGNKVIHIKPNSAYDLDKELVEVRGSAEIVYLGGEEPNRFISRKALKRVCLWVDENFKVVKILYGGEIPHRIEEDLSVPEEFFNDKLSKKPFGRDHLKDELEIPPFLKNKIL